MTTESTPTPSAHKLGRRAALLGQGFLAVTASSLPGAVNYLIVLVLTFYLSAEATGLYRTLFSYFALTNLVSLCESNKLYVRAEVDNDREGATAVWFGQALFGALLFAFCLLAASLDQTLGWGVVPGDLVWLSAISAIYMATLCYLPQLQARGKFRVVLVTEALKYVSALAAFLTVLRLTQDVRTALAVQLSIMAAWNIALFTLVSARRMKWNLLQAPFRLLAAPHASEARMLTVAAIVPGSLEHIDKLALGAAHGLTAVGVYTLGFSTGRFVYNALKPSIYVFYRRFASQMPSGKSMWLAFVVFSFLGAAMAAALHSLRDVIPAEFHAASAVSTILFLSYGVAMADAMFTQAYIINPGRKSAHVLVANLVGGLICLPLFAAVFILPTVASMFLLALHYPLRHTTTFAVLFALQHYAHRPDR